jgi:hypothetical protein
MIGKDIRAVLMERTQQETKNRRLEILFLLACVVLGLMLALVMVLALINGYEGITRYYHLKQFQDRDKPSSLEHQVLDNIYRFDVCKEGRNVRKESIGKGARLAYSNSLDGRQDG